VLGTKNVTLRAAFDMVIGMKVVANLQLFCVNVTHQGKVLKVIIDSHVVMVLSAFVQRIKSVTQVIALFTALGIKVVANRQNPVRQRLGFLACFRLYTKVKNITNAQRKIMVKYRGAQQQQYIEVSGDLVKKTVSLLYHFVNATTQC